MGEYFVSPQELFINFLERHGIEDKFFFNLVNMIDGAGCLDNLFGFSNPCSYFKNAFKWGPTAEGVDFWRRLNIMWTGFYLKTKRGE